MTDNYIAENEWRGLISKRRMGVGPWITADVTPLINGNGVFNITLVTMDNTAFRLTSRGSGAYASQLMIETLP